MKYRSTRGGNTDLSFQATVFMGLADDGGLLIPHTIPLLSVATLTHWSTLSFLNLCVELFTLYIPPEEIPREAMHQIVQTSFSHFRGDLSGNVIPVTPLSSQSTNSAWLCELYHGPTFAFKDVALQFLGNIFEYFLQDDKRHLTLLAATSGDTGAAAIEGVRGKTNIDIIVLYPEGRVSVIQELQMSTVDEANVHCVCVKNATFDDCQRLVKQCFEDGSFKAAHSLGAVNSINFARIIAQMSYYFWSYFQVLDTLRSRSSQNSVTNSWPSLSFSVPTGNFGDILAGYYCRRMGLPIATLLCATNHNDILNRFFGAKPGHYIPSPHRVTPSLAPAMDIEMASNFERLLYYVSGEDSEKLRQWMGELRVRTGEDAALPGLILNESDTAQARAGFLSSTVTDDAIKDCIFRWATSDTWHGTATTFYPLQSTTQSPQSTRESDSAGKVLDPHTCCGIVAIEQHPVVRPICVLSTAHPGKFPETVNAALQRSGAENNTHDAKNSTLDAKNNPLTCPLPLALHHLSSLPQRGQSLPCSLVHLQTLIRDVMQRREKGV